MKSSIEETEISIQWYNLKILLLSEQEQWLKNNGQYIQKTSNIAYEQIEKSTKVGLACQLKNVHVDNKRAGLTKRLMNVWPPFLG